MKKSIFLLLIFVLLISSSCFALEEDLNIECPNAYLLDDLTRKSAL